MNKHRDSLIIIAIAIILVSILILLSTQIANADHVAPEVQTQVNKQTDLFQKSVSNLPDFTNRLEEGKQAGIDSMGDGGGAAPSGLSSLTKKSKSELESESGELSAINEHELDSRGREEMIRKNAINELYMDYSRPLNVQHMKDAKTMAEAQNRLLDNLFAILKEKAGIDCKTIKGDKKIEPEYFLQIKTTTHKDTVYNQTFCEELRNSYSCNDMLTLRCKVRGIQWGPWQDKQISIPGGELVNFGRAVFWVDHVASKCFEYKLTVGKRRFFKHEIEPDHYIVNSMREFLATKHPGSTIDNISTEMSSSWEGGIFSIDGWSYGGRVLGSKDYAWNTYVVNYKYRDGNPACFEWSEDWSEGCRLQ
jgi:hypothetical protein